MPSDVMLRLNLEIWSVDVHKYAEGGRGMAKQRKGIEYVCGVCGTTVVVTDEGMGIMEDIVCCEKPMKAKAPGVKKRSKTKKRSGKRQASR